MNDLEKCGESCLVLDIGADIGQYTLFAAKLGKQVISLEPYDENILRIHKASTKENLNDKITLIQNVIFNERNKIANLIKKDSSSSMLTNTYEIQILTEGSVLTDSSSSFVKTILFDDFFNQIPKRSGNAKVIMRLNLNGLERFWLENAMMKLLDSEYDLKSIYMSWFSFKDDLKALTRTDQLMIKKLIDFLLNRNYQPLEISTFGRLNTREWENWPEFIVWKKKEF